MSGTIRIGGASGYWGEAVMATAQLLADGRMDYLVYDYLAEITMSIMARARARDAKLGYATDFVSEAMTPNLKAIARDGVKVLSNAGGVNPAACTQALRDVIEQAGLDLSVGVVSGDDLIARKQDLAALAPREMFSGDAFPAADDLASINAYLGALPVVAALRNGADIVITGRCADSALSLAACMHAFDWRPDQWDLLAAGSLAGHLLECGPQVTGGNFTDWRDVADTIHDIGYPIAEVDRDGAMILTKPAGTGGRVSCGTVAEQLLYEIDDPQAYVLPDVVCDFSAVTIDQQGNDRVRVSGAKGAPATESYKVCATFMDGYRAGMLLSFCGFEAEDKARRFADAVFQRAGADLEKAGAPGFTETSVEVLGPGDQYGDHRRNIEAREVVLKIAAKHADARAMGLLIKTISGLALATPPGLSIFNAGRPKPSPVVRLFSFLLAKEQVPVQVEVDDQPVTVPVVAGAPLDRGTIVRPETPGTDTHDTAMTEVPLIALAYARSGDKGDKANIGVIARRPEYLPWIWAALTEETVARRFSHFLKGGVTRYLLPGPWAINFVLDNALGGGGVASLRNDPQGKAFGQILLDETIAVPADLAASL